MLLPDDYTDAAPGVLTAGSVVRANFEVRDDDDKFKINLEAGVLYSFSLAPATAFPSNSSGNHLTLYLFNAAGKLIVEQVNGLGLYGPSFEYRPETSGSYTLRANWIWHGDSGLGAYTVSAAVRSGVDDFTASAATAGVLPVGGSASGVFESLGEHDWLRFSATAGMHYEFNLTTVDGATSPGRIRVVDAAGRPLSYEASAPFDPEVSGDYYLDLHGLQTGAYSVTSTVVADDYSAYPSRQGLLQPGTSMNGAIQFFNDVDGFRFTLEAGKFYNLSVGGEGLNYGLVLVSPDGYPLQGITGDSQVGPSMTFQATTSGEYSAFVTAYMQSGTGTYSLSLSAGARDVIGDTIAGARLAIVGQPSTSTLEGISDTDVFKVTLLAGITYAFALETSQSGTKLQFDLTNSAGTVLEQAGSANSAYYTFTPAVAGDYFAHVKGEGASIPVSDYSLRVSRPSDNVAANAGGAGSLSVGNTVSGVLEAGGGDRDWYGVNLTGGTTYWFSLNNGTMDFVNRGQLRLLDSAGAVQASTTARYDMLAETLSFRPLFSGKYYLEVASAERTTGGYAVTAAVGLRDDYGMTAATAGVLSTLKPLSGRFELATDTDLIKISVTAGETYGLNLQGAEGAAPGLELKNSAGLAIATTSWGEGSTQQRLFTATASGDVFATLTNGAGNGAISYTLAQTEYGPDDVASGSGTLARLAVGGGLRGAISNPIDTDSFKVALQAGRGYLFQLIGTSGGNTLATLDPANFYLSRTGDAAGDVNAGRLSGAAESRLLYVATTSGDYYLNVGPAAGSGMGSYTVKATMYSGDTAAPALIAQSHANGATNVSLTERTLSFTFSEAILVKPAGITLHSASGTQVLLDNGVVSDNKLTFKMESYLAPGSYTVQLPATAVTDIAGNGHGGPVVIKFSTVQPAAAPTAGNDLLRGGTGAALDGGSGIDTAVYASFYTDYTVTRAGSKFSIFSNKTGFTDTLVNVERLLFGSDAIALDTDGTAGQAYRLYQAAFHRTPDLGGLGYWISQLDKGISMASVAQAFVGSAEFKSLYGAATTDMAFINLLYNNVLNRPADTAGATYWATALGKGFLREDLLIYFSESAENQAAVAEVIGQGIPYTPF